MTDIKIYVDGHVDDLYALALLFPDCAFPGLTVVTALKGAKDGSMDRVIDATDTTTYVTGEGCAPLLEATNYGAADWVAKEILAPLNGYAVLADSNFVPVTPICADIKYEHGWMGLSFRTAVSKEPRRIITVDRHPFMRERRNARVELMASMPIAAYASSVIGSTPNWADYYRLLEDIAGERGTTLDKLAEAGLAKRPALNAFKSAANNRVFGRHGASKRDTRIDQSTLMNLLEAREFVRSVVTRWLDQLCGDVMPTDRVDGSELRFGLDDRDDD